MAEGMRTAEEIAIIEAESNLVEMIGGANNLPTLLQMLTGFASEEAGGGLRAIETSTHIFSRQAAILEQLIADVRAEGAEAVLTRFPQVSTGAEVVEKYGIALKVRSFLEKRTIAEKGDEVDFDLTKEEELDLLIN